MESPERCPFLVPVTADHLWMYPMPAYCRRPAEALKVPARETFMQFCASPRFARCPGYRSSVRRGEGGDS